MSNTCFSILNGGLCNQLFEIAAAYAHCRRHEYNLQISSTIYVARPSYWDSYLHNFSKNVVPQSRVNIILLWKEPHFHYVTIPKNATSVFGFFQSSKYFNDYASEIRELFQPSHDIIQNVTSKYHELLSTSDKVNTIVIHVRRTDYITQNHKETHGILTLDYYERAMDEIKQRIQNPHFLIFSDDLDWCRQQVCFSSFGSSVTFVDEPNDCMALYLMSQFRHYIMANSTFSWWATWLGEPSEVVIAPDRWFGPNGPQDWQDIYEPHWIRIPVNNSE